MDRKICKIMEESSFSKGFMATIGVLSGLMFTFISIALIYKLMSYIPNLLNLMLELFKWMGEHLFLMLGIIIIFWWSLFVLSAFINEEDNY